MATARSPTRDAGGSRPRLRQDRCGVGEVRPDVDVDADLLVDLVTGAAYYRLLRRGEAITEAAVGDVVDLALATRPGGVPGAPGSEDAEVVRERAPTEEWAMTVNQPTESDRNSEVVDWADLGKSMWEFLTGRRAAIHYRLENMTVEVPRDTGPRAPRAVWKLDGTLTITTDDTTASESTR